MTKEKKARGVHLRGTLSKDGSEAKTLSDKETEILRLVQEGKTTDEIAVIIGKSKWTAKYHIKRIFRKFNVTNRASAVSAAIGRGIMPPTRPPGYVPEEKKLRIGIVGCGKGGTAILNLFRGNPLVEIAWAADRDASAPGLAVAAEMNVPTAADYRKFLGKKVDVIINLSGSKSVFEDLRRSISSDIELMGGLSARIMWQLFEERRRRRRVEDREPILTPAWLREAVYAVVPTPDSYGEPRSRAGIRGRFS